MGQSSSRVLQPATDHSSDTAHRAPAGLMHRAMAEQQWKWDMDAKREALRCQLMTFLENGMQSTVSPPSHPLQCGRRAVQGQLRTPKVHLAIITCLVNDTP